MSVKELRRLEIIQKLEQQSLKQIEGAVILGLSERHIKRSCRAYQEQGASGVSWISQQQPTVSPEETKDDGSVMQPVSRFWPSTGLREAGRSTWNFYFNRKCTTYLSWRKSNRQFIYLTLQRGHFNFGLTRGRYSLTFSVWKAKIEIAIISVTLILVWQ